jgi:hypothetical protein
MGEYEVSKDTRYYTSITWNYKIFEILTIDC